MSRYGLLYQSSPLVQAHVLKIYCGGRAASRTGRAVCHRNSARVRGRKFFHSRCIRWSYRKRGYDARVHRNKTVKMVVFSIKFIVNICGEILIPGLRKRMVVSVFIIIMFAYSARKNRANGPAAYSTLNPDTSSDSPSVRSNGARFVSARVEINPIMVRRIGAISGFLVLLGIFLLRSLQ